MKLTVEIEVQTDCGSTPLFEDVEKAVRDYFSSVVYWRDASLDRTIHASVSVESVKEIEAPT